jgi:hypothetical protein
VRTESGKVRADKRSRQLAIAAARLRASLILGNALRDRGTDGRKLFPNQPFEQCEFKLPLQ